MGKNLIYNIYTITNSINNKVYIGFTKDFTQRKHLHKKSALKENSQYYIHRAIRKYGWERFNFEIIYQSKDKINCLKTMEPYFIREYNSFGVNGYNQTLGGDGGGIKRSEKTKQKLRDSYTPERIERYKQNNIGQNNPMYGKKSWCNGVKNPFSKETTERMSSIKKGKPVSDNCKIAQFKKMAKSYIILTPNNEEIQITGLNKFCKEQKLHTSNLIQQGHCKGYKILRRL